MEPAELEERLKTLHAETLEFTHPTTGEALRTTAPVPADMQQLLRALREDARAASDAAR